MKKLLKTIGLLALLSAVAGLVYNILKAVNLKNQDDLDDFEYGDGKHLVKRCIFDGVEEEVDVCGKESLSLVCHFAVMDLDLSGAENAGDKLLVDLDISFGGIEITLPNTWKIINETSCIVGGIDYEECDLSEDCSTLILTGKILFGGVALRYVDDNHEPANNFTEEPAL